MHLLPRTISGTVTHGKGLGHDFGVPTANIIPREDLAGLDFGVYYSQVLTDGKRFNAVTNLGKRPSVDDGETVNAESFIYDYEGELYGKEISVTLIEFKRPEERFASLEALFETIHKDIEDGKGYSYPLIASLS